MPLTEMDKLAAGDKVYMNVRNCGLVAAVVGSSDPLEGFNLVGAHVDSRVWI